ERLERALGIKLRQKLPEELRVPGRSPEERHHIAVPEKRLPQASWHLREVVHDEGERDPEAPQGRERRLEALRECGRIEQVEELVADELVGALPAPAREGGLKEQLEKQAPHHLHLLLGDTRALPQEE